MKSNLLPIAALLLTTGFMTPLQAASVTLAERSNDSTASAALKQDSREQDLQRQQLFERLEQERRRLEQNQADRDAESEQSRQRDRTSREQAQRERDRQAEERRQREEEQWQETERRNAQERDRDRREAAERLEEERQEQAERIRERLEEESRRQRDRLQESESDRRWEESRRDWLRRQEEARRNWERQQNWENWQRYQDSLQWNEWNQWNQWNQSYPSSSVQTTRIELRSLTNDWVTVRIEGLTGEQEISFTGSNDHQSIYLSPGAYRLSFRSTLSSSPWQSGYLHVGRTGTLRIEFDQDDRYIEVYDDPAAWSSDLSFQPF